MLEETHDPLNPDSEQQLYEKLTMSPEDLAMLEYIRKDMKSLLGLKKKSEKQSNTDKLEF